jgi:hypothetical protein
MTESQGYASTEQRLVVLRTPSQQESARNTVRRFLRAVVSEDEKALQSLMTEDAQVRTDRRGTRWQAHTFWRLRFSRLDYTQLEGQLLYRDGSLQTYRAQDMPLLDPPRDLPVQLEEPQVLVHVPILTRVLNGQALFGDAISFVLVPRGSGSRIVLIVESFQIP